MMPPPARMSNKLYTTMVPVVHLNLLELDALMEECGELDRLRRKLLDFSGRRLYTKRPIPMAHLVERQLPSKTRRGWVVKAILRSIFTGEFKGGDRLVENELA